MTEQSEDIHHPHLAPCSVESLLSVPLQIIFRETQSNNHKSFLFSKSEVSTLLRVNMLSSELDALLSVVYEALNKSQQFNAHRRCIEIANQESSAKGALFRAMLPVLNVHIETAEDALSHATCESFGITRILNELEACANDLRKFAEQNHTLADQLDHFIASGINSNLSGEKRAIAEVEEAVVKTIENLKLLSACKCSDSGQSEGTPAFNEESSSMSDVCESLFPRQAHSVKNAPPCSLEKNRYSESQMIAAEALQGLCTSPSDKE